MPAQKELVGKRFARPRTGGNRAAETPPASRPVKSGRMGWILGLAAFVIVALAVQVGLSRARLAQYPPLLAWDGPDAGSATRETELRLVEAARRSPADPKAQLALGQFYLDDDKPFEALWALRDAQRLDPKALEPRLLLARAMEMGQLYQPAIDLLQTAVRDFPKDTEAARRLADLQLSVGQAPEAAATLQAAAARQPLADDALLLYGHALEATGKDAEALKQYQAYQQASPKSEKAYLAIGKLLFRMGKTADARQAFLAAQVLNTRSAEARYYQGLIELKQGPSHEGAARQKFVEAVGYDERFAPAHVQIGAYYQRHHDWEKASNVLSRAFQLDPDNADAIYQLAQVRRAMGDLAGATYNLGLYYDDKDARPRARAQYESLAKSGLDPRGPLMVSGAYIKMDHKVEAAKAARDGLQRRPGDVELLERLVALDLLTGNTQEAEQLCRDWTRRDPSSSRPVWLLGRVRLAAHNWDEALKLFRRAAAAEPRNAEYQFSLGSVYAGQPSRANWEIAARYFGQAVTLDPDEARYRQNLGIALQNLGQLEGARRQFLRAMDKDVNQSAPLNNIVQVARGLKQFDQVEFWAPLVREVEQRLREELPSWKKVWDHPQDPAGYAPLAQFLARTGELRKARNVLEQAVALKPEPATRRQLAILQRTLDIQS